MTDRPQVLVHRRADAGAPRRACCPANMAEDLPHPLLKLIKNRLHVPWFLLQLLYMSMHGCYPNKYNARSLRTP